MKPEPQIRQGSASSPADSDGGRWTVDPRTFGEVTVAEASLNDIHAVVFVAARNHSADHLQNQLEDLLEDACQTPDPAMGRRSIPPAMQRVVRSLLEWAEELNRDGVTLWSLAFFSSTSTPVVAHVNGEEPRIETEDGVLTPQSLVLRGEEGGQARALCLRPGRVQAISLTWSTGAARNGAGASLEAEWLLEPRADDEIETPAPLLGSPGRGTSDSPALHLVPQAGVEQDSPAAVLEPRADDDEASAAAITAAPAEPEAPAPEPGIVAGRGILDAILSDVDEIPGVEFDATVLAAHAEVESVEPAPSDETTTRWRSFAEKSRSEEPSAAAAAGDALGSAAAPAAPEPPDGLELREPVRIEPGDVAEPASRPWAASLPERHEPAAEASPVVEPPASEAPGAAPVPAVRPFVPQAPTYNVPEEWSKSVSVAAAPRPARPLINSGSRLGGATRAETSGKAQRPRPQRPKPQRPQLPTAVSRAPRRAQTPAWLAGLASREQRIILLIGAVLAVAFFAGGLMLGGGGDLPQTAVPATTTHPGAGAAATLPQGTPVEAGSAPVGDGGAIAGPTGNVEIRASFVDGVQTRPAGGARVWVDGKLRGTLPLSLELSRGRHSLRSTYRAEESPITVIDLPGGATQAIEFQFGTGGDQPRLVLLKPEASSRERVITISGYLDRVRNDEVKEMWVHLRDRGVWRRFPMALLSAPGGTVGVAVVPADLLKGPNAAPYYVSATRNESGEQYFTEIQNPGSL